MKNMVDRYLYDVSKRLPENIRADVERELRSNIEDMLPDNPSEEDIERVLKELGSPAKLAVRYNPRPRYLVSPELFDDYMTAFKAVSITLAVILALFAVFKIVFGDTGGVSPVQLLINVIVSFISSAFTGVVQAFFWVTIVFYCIGYYGNKKELREWSPKNLPEIPADSKSSFKKADIVGNAFFSILFTILFLIGTLRQPPFIAWYQAGQPAAPLFNGQLVQSYLPLYLFLLLLTLVIASLKFIQNRWTVSSAAFQCLYSISSAAIGVTFLTRPGAITDAFISRFADKVHVTIAAMTGYIHTGITVICVLIVIGTIADIATTAGKTARNYR
jgi:hypothetical protein